MLEKIGRVRIENPKDLVYVGELNANSYFRGQGNEKWDIVSTLERDAENFNVPSRFCWERESTMLRLFQERANLYLPETEKPDSLFGWQSLIRHHGGPSRLLDVSSSYLVAAYFALCNSVKKQDAVIWIFRDDIISGSSPENYDSVFNKNSKPGITIASPSHLNSRINAQSGMFFIPGNLEHSTQDQLSLFFKTDFNSSPMNYKSVRKVESELQHNVWKIVMPHKFHSEMFSFVSRCNVRAYTLFPGISGLAESLKEMMRSYE